MEGLNVVDFPGVDDEDDSIGELADLLLTIAQIVIFVVDYRYLMLNLVYCFIMLCCSYYNLLCTGKLTPNQLRNGWSGCKRRMSHF